MKVTILIFLFSLMIFSYSGYADSNMSSDENSSDVEKQESVSQQEESSEDMETFNIDERPDGHAPIGVVGDHVHDQGELMFSFRMMMRRTKYGERRVSGIRTPHKKEFITMDKDLRRDMWMGMFDLMYGLTDQWTVMTMVPYLLYDIRDGEIDHALGDISLSVLYAPLKESSYRMVLSLEVFFPTTGFDAMISGVMEQRGGKKIHYEFPRPWSAYAFFPKLSTLFYLDQLSLGFLMGFKYFFTEDQFRQFEGVLEPTAHIWGACNLSKNFSVSLRGVYQGDDIAVFTKRALFERVLNSKHSVLTYLGLNFIGTDFLKGHRLAFEAGLSVYPNSLFKEEQSYVFQLGWKKAF